MDDDTAPRITPPPKPTILQLSTPKPEVPEVSLMFDSDDSLIWQVSRSSNLKEKNQSFEHFAKQNKIQFSNQNRTVSSVQVPATRDLINATGKNDYDINSIPRKTQVTNVHCAPSSRTENKIIEDMASETRAADQRFQDSQIHNSCDVAALSLTHTGITDHVRDRLYNPNLYSPTVKQKHSPLTNNVTSGAQQHPTLTENFVSPQGRPVWNVVSPHIFNSRPATPPVSRPAAPPVCRLATPPVSRPAAPPVCRRATPPVSRPAAPPVRPATPPVIKKVMFSQDNISSSPVETESDSTNKIYLFPGDSRVPHYQNLENINPSFPSDQQLRIPTDSRACISENVSNHHYSPASITLPAQAYQSVQDRRCSGQVRQGCVYPQPFSYSPQSLNGRLYSSPDPMVYRLIEDQNQQILKLTETIERIVEKQQVDKSPIEANSSKLANSKTVQSEEEDDDQDNLHKDISTQTHTTSMPEKRCVGVNTDLSWPDLIASIRDCGAYEVHDHWGFNSAERSKVNKEITSNDMSKDNPREIVDPDRYQRKQKLNSHRSSPLQGNISESSKQEGPSLTEEGVLVPTQEDHPRSHPSLPIGLPGYHDSRVQEEFAGHLRNDGKRTVEFGSSLALGESASTYRNNVQNQDQPINPTSLPTGGTFYNNVLTNIQQILKSSKSLHEEREHKQLDRDNLQTSRPVEANTEKTLPDPQIEAVRKQLLQFGISFIDPASLASDHTSILDTMYLPGVHNMLSLYQSTVSTHYQSPYQETDATAAKYLTDSQLAAIAAMSPAVTRRHRGAGTVTSHDYPIPIEDINSQERRSESQLYKFTVNNNFSMATKKFLDRYGLQDD